MLKAKKALVFHSPLNEALPECSELCSSDCNAPDTLFLTAGPFFPPNKNKYDDGLFGVITARGDDDSRRSNSTKRSQGGAA
jgi:hypothetical protein